MSRTLSAEQRARLIELVRRARAKRIALSLLAERRLIELVRRERSAQQRRAR